MGNGEKLRRFLVGLGTLQPTGGERYGQALYHYLFKFNWKAAEKLTGTEFDPWWCNSAGDVTPAMWRHIAALLEEDDE